MIGLRVALCIVSVALFTSPGVVRAQSAEYLRLSQEAIAEADAGRFAEAYALFSSAYRLEPNARAARALGNTAFELRHYADAMRHFEEALASTVRPLTPAQRTEVETMVGRTSPFVGRYVFSIEPEHATATLDAAPIDVQEAIWVDLGEHELVVSAPGYTEVRRAFSVRGGERESIDLALTGSSGVSLAGFGSIEVRGGEGGRVLVDGTFVCTAPCRAEHIAVGPHEIRVERLAHEPFRAVAEVRLDEVSTLEVQALVGSPDVWTLRVPDTRRLRVGTTTGLACDAMVTASTPCTLVVPHGDEGLLTFASEDGAFAGSQAMPPVAGGADYHFRYAEVDVGGLWAFFVGAVTIVGPITSWAVAGTNDAAESPDTEALYGVASAVTAVWLGIVIPFAFLDPVRGFALEADAPSLRP